MRALTWSRGRKIDHVTMSVKQTEWSRKDFLYVQPKFHPNPTGRNASSTSCIPKVLFQYLCDCERETDCTGGHGQPFSTRIRNFIQIRPVETRPVPLVYHKYFSSTCATVSVKWITQVVLEGHFLRGTQISSQSDHWKLRNASSTSCIPQVLFQYLRVSLRKTDCAGVLGKSFSTSNRNCILIRPVEAEKRVQYLMYTTSTFPVLV